MSSHVAVYLQLIYFRNRKKFWTAVFAVSQLHMDFPFPSITKKPEISQGKLRKCPLYSMAVESALLKHFFCVCVTLTFCFNDGSDNNAIVYRVVPILEIILAEFKVIWKHLY